MKLFFVGILGVCSVFGGLKNPIVVAGGAIFDGMRIEVKDRTIIHWSDFSIGENEWVEFALPHPDATVLNRVLEAVPSRLMGELRSNGGIVLVNPSGILVGKEGSVDASAFVALSLDVVDWVFVERGVLVGREVSWGVVANEGRLCGQEVCLVGFEVQNGGMIEGEEIGLVGAKEVEIQIRPFAVETRSERAGLREVLEEQNWYRFVLIHPEDEDWPEIARWLEVEILNMPGPTVIQRGEISGQEVYCLGDYIDVRSGSLIEGKRVWIGGKKEAWKGARMIRLGGIVKADQLVGQSDGALRYFGEFSTQEMEISAGIFLDPLYHDGHD